MNGTLNPPKNFVIVEASFKRVQRPLFLALAEEEVDTNTRERKRIRTNVRAKHEERRIDFTEDHKKICVRNEK